MNLVIVESPTKAKTISKFLGKKFLVKSSYGHLRDLPKNRLGIDVKKDFAPTYVVDAKNKKTVDDLKTAAKKSDTVYFATDEDREGEAIAWHLQELLKTPGEKTKRITFHEITREAIQKSLENPRTINMNLVDAQQTRRILDRIVGYQLSPFLWRKVAKGLSAGRVQSVALRLIVEREREITTFQRQEYWTIEAIFTTNDGKEFGAKLISVDGNALKKFDIGTEKNAQKILDRLKGLACVVHAITRREIQRIPQPPFTTSTLQQEANRILGFSAKQTMKVAQDLYEGVEIGKEGSLGLITYMRTDSVQLSEKFQHDAKEIIEKLFGANFVPTAPRIYKTKSRLAQEAHEAIRPTETARTPEELKPYLNEQQWKLYNLIWNRALASQMPNAILDTTTVDIADTNTAGVFRATGSILKFPGFLRLYEVPTKETILPELAEGSALTTKTMTQKQHFTEPPARYNDATLVKALEQHGIGRPSTYAPTIATILERNYVVRVDARQLMPTDLGILVNDLLVNHFPEIIDYQFTAKMEDDLDEIAQGEKKWVPILKEFYAPFSDQLAKKEKEVSREVVQELTNEICKNCGKAMVVRMSKYGKFLACSGFPACRYTAKIANAGVGKEPAKAQETTSHEEKKCPKCGGVMEEKFGRFGAYFKCATCGATETKRVTVGVTCPLCNKGEILERKTKRGRTFYSCSRYPDCTFALWNKPTGEKCPLCASLVVVTPKGQKKCSNKSCSYEPNI